VIKEIHSKITLLKRNLQDPKLVFQLAKYFYNRRHLKHLIPLFFVFFYMIIGSIFFYYLEANAEMEKIMAKSLYKLKYIFSSIKQIISEMTNT